VSPLPAVAMFPLGTVLLPGGILPLHVFEDRYRRLVERCRHSGEGFGVVLIERGSEVGGGEVRTDVGTLAVIARHAALPDGRLAVLVAGTHRLRVRRWLADDPHPWAEAERWPDRPPGPWARQGLDAVVARLRSVAALRAEVGDEPAAEVPGELADDVVLASYEAVGLSTLGPFDRQGLLAAEGPDERLERLGELLDDELAILRRRLELGAG
jgi:Lon protease-like protein